MKISFLLPSRKRPVYLTECIESIFAMTSQDNEAEVLVAFDDNDETRFQILEKFSGDNRVRMFTRYPVGFWKLHEYTNFLAGEASGDMFFVFTDKSLMLTQNWDTLLRPFLGKFVIAYPYVDWIGVGNKGRIRPEMLLPIIPKLWYDILGKVSDQPHIDSYVAHVMYGLDIFAPNARSLWARLVRPIPEMMVSYHGLKSTEGKPVGVSTFFSDEEKSKRIEDARRIWNFLENNPQYLP